MERLSPKDSTIEIKTAIDAKVAEIDTLKNKLPSRLGTDDAYDTIADTKLGVDVLYAILKTRTSVRWANGTTP